MSTVPSHAPVGQVSAKRLAALLVWLLSGDDALDVFSVIKAVAHLARMINRTLRDLRDVQAPLLDLAPGEYAEDDHEALAILSDRCSDVACDLLNDVITPPARAARGRSAGRRVPLPITGEVVRRVALAMAAAERANQETDDAPYQGVLAAQVWHMAEPSYAAHLAELANDSALIARTDAAPPPPPGPGAERDAYYLLGNFAREPSKDERPGERAPIEVRNRPLHDAANDPAFVALFVEQSRVLAAHLLAARQAKAVP